MPEISRGLSETQWSDTPGKMSQMDSTLKAVAEDFAPDFSATPPGWKKFFLMRVPGVSLALNPRLMSGSPPGWLGAPAYRSNDTPLSARNAP